MEKDYIVHETHIKSITSVAAHIARREIYLGFEDGCIKSLEADTGKHVQTYQEHKGWITSFLYWPLNKLLFSSSNDSIIVCIGPGGNVVDKIFIGIPIYTMILNNKRKEIIFGCMNGLQFHKLNDNKDNTHYIDDKPTFVLLLHNDIVKCLLTSDSRIYSAGYDGALVIYECHYTGKESAKKCFLNRNAHDAGITCLLVEKDTLENNTWLVTGSFDKTLKIWTNDGKIIHKFDGFITSITGICYLPKNKTIWAIAGTSSAYIYDPKSGENVTDFVDTFSQDKLTNNSMANINQHYYLQLISYFNDFNIMVTTTSRKQLIVFKYNPYGCITCLKYKSTLDSLCFTYKAPILIFTGDSNGNVFKWEQMHTSQLVYGYEKLIKNENNVIKESSYLQGSQQQQLNENKGDLNNDKMKQEEKGDCNESEEFIDDNNNKTIVRLIFVEKLDLIIGSSEDSNIYVWGFDDEAVKILKNMKPLLNNENVASDEQTNNNNNDDNDINLNEININNEKNSNDSVTNRVAGFILKRILSEHTSCVTSLCLIDRLDVFSSIYLLSSGWDKRICIWDLNKLKLFDKFRNYSKLQSLSNNNIESIELASDGNILDMCYCEKNNHFAYSSTDTMCYIRKFSTCGSEMQLVNVLQGHTSEVNCIRWSKLNLIWITGGEDSTIRIWSEYGDTCLQIINTNGTVNCICMDDIQNSIIVAAHDTIKIYEYVINEDDSSNNEYQLVQTNIGHLDSIRDIIYINERNQYISVSWDKTIRVWRAWRKSSLIKQKVEINKDNDYNTWIWEQLKLATKLDTMDNKINSTINLTD